MPNLIRRIRTKEGDIPIDHNALANLPSSDKTLAVDGGFADAKAVGDELDKKINNTDLSDWVKQSLKPVYTSDEVGADAAGTAEAKISEHNVSSTSHNDVRLLIQKLTERLNTLADSDDVTLDQLSEIVAYIKNNKDLIDGITTSKVNVDDIINNLITNISNKPLSAAQGVELKRLIDSIVVPLIDSTLTKNGEAADAKKVGDELAKKLNSTDISDWAKAKTKPTYTSKEVGAMPEDANTLPTGGIAGEILVKKSEAEGDAEWVNAPGEFDMTYREEDECLVLQNKTQVPGNVGVDKTLTKSDNAADAKVVGDKFSQLYEALVNLQEILTRNNIS